MWSSGAPDARREIEGLSLGRERLVLKAERSASTREVRVSQSKLVLRLLFGRVSDWRGAGIEAFQLLMSLIRLLINPYHEYSSMD